MSIIYLTELFKISLDKYRYYTHATIVCSHDGDGKFGHSFVFYVLPIVRRNRAISFFRD